MLPAFTHDRWGEGLVAGTQRVAQRLLEQAHTLHPPAEPRHPTLAVRDVVYGIGWGYFVGWLGVLLIHRVRHHILSSRVLALITLPGVGFLVWAFIPFIVPFLIGLVPLAANVRARCPTCGRWLSRRKRTVRTPTRDKLRETVADCLACGYHDVQLAIPGHSAWYGSSGPGVPQLVWRGGLLWLSSYGVPVARPPAAWVPVTAAPSAAAPAVAAVPGGAFRDVLVPHRRVAAHHTAKHPTAGVCRTRVDDRALIGGGGGGGASGSR